MIYKLQIEDTDTDEIIKEELYTRKTVCWLRYKKNCKVKNYTFYITECVDGESTFGCSEFRLTNIC